MRRNTFFLVSCFVFFFSAGFVFGQGFTGPDSVSGTRMGQSVTLSEPVTVAQVRALPIDSWVILTGNIVASLPGGRYYTFRDATGEITVEIEWSVWRGLSVGPSDRVTIYGELESRRGQLSIEVEAIIGQGSVNTRQGQAVTITSPISVSEVKKLPKSSWVVLIGYVTRLLQDEYYIFSDESGEITVEIESDVWRGISVTPSDRVEISGEIEIKRRQLLVEVKSIRKF